jgi:hypothetical protein
MEGHIKRKGTDFLEISQDSTVLRMGTSSYKFDAIQVNEFNQTENSVTLCFSSNSSLKSDSSTYQSIYQTASFEILKITPK